MMCPLPLQPSPVWALPYPLPLGKKCAFWPQLVHGEPQMRPALGKEGGVGGGAPGHHPLCVWEGLRGERRLGLGEGLLSCVPGAETSRAQQGGQDTGEGGRAKV